MVKYHFYLLLLASTKLFLLLNANYLLQELDGNLIRHSTLSFSMFIRRFIGMVIYAVDCNHKFMIELERNDKGNLVYIQLNEMEINETSRTLCGCIFCSNIYMTVGMRLSERKLEIICNGTTHSFNIHSFIHYSNVASKEYYPNPPKYSEIKTKMTIFLGNIGPFVGNKNKTYLPLKNQLTGCLDKFYYNGNLISVIETGKNFTASCPTQYRETIYKNQSNESQSTSYNIFDCSISALNPRYCRRDLPIFIGQNKTIIMAHVIRQSILIRLEWQNVTDNNYCLLEIQLKNKSSITFHVQHNFLKTSLGLSGLAKNLMKRMKEKLSTDRNILIVHFYNSTIITKVSSGDEIRTFYDTFDTDPELCNIGFSEKSGICSSFSGRLDFRYQFGPLQSATQTELLTKSQIVLCICVGCALLAILVLTVKFKLIRYFKPEPMVDMSMFRYLDSVYLGDTQNRLGTIGSDIYDFMTDEQL